jgi:hypothetical protein
MRKIVVSAFLSLDGVMQSPGGPYEDPVKGFKHGGWVVPYFDEAMGNSVSELFAMPFDLLLGRKTYEIFAAHWPNRLICAVLHRHDFCTAIFYGDLYLLWGAERCRIRACSIHEVRYFERTPVCESPSQFCWSPHRLGSSTAFTNATN